MFESLVYYQGLAQKFQGQLLTTAGIAIVLVGLCIWLAGLRFKCIVSAIVGAIVAAAGVVTFGDYPAKILLVASAVGIIVGAIAGRFMLGIFAMIVGGLLVITVVSGRLQPAEAGGVEFFDANSFNTKEIAADDFVSSSAYPTWPQYQQKGVVIPTPAAIDITVKMSAHLIGLAKKTVLSAGITAYGGAAGVILAVIFFCFILPRFFVAVISAALGSAVIFAGMVTLLFYKGSEPISLIAAKPQFYGIAFGAMTVFGTIMQLLLSPAEPKIIKPNVSKKENGE
ncbi:MAG: hypothetical protein WC770_07970 [Phycisphaerae bacterium]|jgi:hypothetical protein